MIVKKGGGKMVKVLIAFSVGAWFGVALMCCMFAAKEADKHIGI